MALGPSGPATLAGLLLLFAGAAVLLARSRRLPLQTGAGVVAFVAAATFGVSAVNAYYDYYRSWGDLFADLAADNGTPATAVTIPKHAGTTAAPTPPGPAAPASAAPDAGPWHVQRVAFPGEISGVSGRSAIVIVPPDASGPLPVLELLHGEPGGPDSWIGGLRLADVLRQEAAAGRIRPMLVVLPDVQGFRDQQCLDPVRGRRLGTYLQQDVPADIMRLLPAQPSGAAWVIGGLSEGGYCAADVVLHQPALFRGAALMDGYFHPAVTRSVLRRVFGGDRSRVAAQDPTQLVETWDPQHRLPLFWLMAGTGNAVDYTRAVSFARLVDARAPVRFVTVTGGRHTTPAWRVALPDLLDWASSVLSGHPYSGSLVARVQ